MDVGVVLIERVLYLPAGRTLQLTDFTINGIEGSEKYGNGLFLVLKVTHRSSTDHVRRHSILQSPFG